MKRAADTTQSLLLRLRRPDIARVLGAVADQLDDAWQRLAPVPAAVEAELLATLVLLDALEADAEMQAACILHTCQQCGIVIAEAELKRLPAGLRDLVDGEHAAEKVWSLYAARSGAGSAEGLRRLLLAIIRDPRVVLIRRSRQLARLRAAGNAAPEQRRELASSPPTSMRRSRTGSASGS